MCGRDGWKSVDRRRGIRLAACFMSKSPATNPIVFRSESEAMTMAIGESLAKKLRGGDALALEGPLGSGKTCFVRGLARGLGLDPSTVSSPTFVICQEYSARLPFSSSLTLAHIDAYRLSGPGELETIGWNELLEAKDVVIAVEWPSRIAKALPTRRIEIQFEHVGEHARSVTLAIPGELTDRFQDLNLATIDSKATSAARCRTCGKQVDASS